MAIKFVTNTHMGLVRSNNEDYTGNQFTQNGHVFVLCDGMGGHAGGEVAAKIAVDCVLEFMDKTRLNDIQEGICQALNLAHEQIQIRIKEEPGLKGMGTTCAVLVFNQKNQIFYGHIGDSRIYIHSGAGLIRLTKDHSYVQELIDRGVINVEEAKTHPQRSQIIQALGLNNIIPSVAAFPEFPKAGDLFLLCSDGLTEMVSDSEIESILNCRDLNIISRKLMDKALANGGKDNISLQVIQVIENENLLTGVNDDINKKSDSHNHTDKLNLRSPVKNSGYFWQIFLCSVLLGALIFITLKFYKSF